MLCYCIMPIVRGGKLSRFSRISLQSQRFSSEFFSFYYKVFSNCCTIAKVFPRITRRSCNRKTSPPRTIFIIRYVTTLLYLNGLQHYITMGSIFFMNNTLTTLVYTLHLPLRTVHSYMCQGNKYFTVHKQINITLPPFTLLTWNQFHFVYYSLLYTLLYWAKHDNQLKAEKSPSKA